MTRKTAGASDLVEVEAEKRHETENAILIFDGEVEAWIPKSQCEDNGDGTFTMPEWLATSKGLI